MTNSIHDRILAVAQMAHRNARNSDETVMASALLDELKTTEVTAGSVKRGAAEAEHAAEHASEHGAHTSHGKHAPDKKHT